MRVREILRVACEGDRNSNITRRISTMNGLKDGWYSEVSAFSPGQAMSIEVEGPPLHHEKSEFQDIIFFKTKHWGNMLVLDGAIQCTEKDESAYQEMITHLPLYAHPNPKKVTMIMLVPFCSQITFNHTGPHYWGR